MKAPYHSTGSLYPTESVLSFEESFDGSLLVALVLLFALVLVLEMVWSFEKCCVCERADSTMDNSMEEES